MIIIGITGTLGAGKGAVVEYLVEKYDFRHYSARAFISEEIERRNIPVDRDSMTLVANDLRQTHHPGYIIEQLYEQAAKAHSNAVIESVRTAGEIDTLKKKAQTIDEKFYLFAVDADPHTRYDRIQGRKSATDTISYDKFLSDEEREMHSIDPTKQNLKYCISQADYVFQNDGNFEDLHAQIDVVMKTLV